jgi:sulfite reductase beta subunit-like hemoprotein
MAPIEQRDITHSTGSGQAPSAGSKELAGSHGRARLSFANQSEIDEFVSVLGRFERGELTTDEWRAFRLVRGTYGQRQTDDAQMLRVKIPQGILTPEQLEALADVAERYSRGFGHITTRQNVQFHFMRLHDVEPAMRRLADAGLTTREACGSAVRNITACPYAGVAHDEAFDVTPYAEALTRYLLRHPLSATLPRKFKIAFEGCADDHIAAAINDIGWHARVQYQDGRVVRGFRVTVAGGTSTMTRAGEVLFEFLPAGAILDLAESILRVFHRLGDFKHKQRNRMKFLVKTLGWQRFRAEVEDEFQRVRESGGAKLPFDPDRAPLEEAPVRRRACAPPDLATIALRAASTPLKGPGIVPIVDNRLKVTGVELARWSRTNVTPQKQAGYSVAVAATLLGDVTASQMRLIGDLAAAFGDGTVRVTADQNVIFRWVRTADADALYRSLAAAGLGRPGAGTLADVTSCPGAESCRLAVTQSRGLGRLLAERLQEREDLAAAVPGLDIKISGCPNGCGQHHVAGIGFQGSLRKVGGRPAPHYFLTVGGGTHEDAATFGRLAATIPARRCPEAVERLVHLYQEQARGGETALAFFRRVDLAIVKAALADLALAAGAASPEDFIDLAEAGEFRPDVQDGECSA